MSSLGSPSTLFLAKKGAYEVDRSLRFNYTEYLTRTPSSTGNQKVWTFSAWIKRTEIESKDYIYSANDGSSGYFALYFKNDNLYTYFDPGNNYGIVSDREFRDTGAWFHIVHQVDALNTTQKIWINGTEMSLNSSRNPSNSNFPMNESGITLYIGKASWKSEYNNMYLAEVHYSDGYKYTPTDFAETNAITGQWVPKSPSISYGTNGFYLNFSTDTLGTDRSGNSNDFTPNNFSVVAGEGNDALEDSPTNNFCTINPLDTYRTGNTVSDGNLKLQRTGSNFGNARGSFAVNSGKWYYEWKCLGTGNQVGWVNTGFDINYNGGDVAVTSSGSNGVGMYLDSRGIMYGWQDSGGNTYFPSSSSYVSYTTGDIIMVAFDIDNFKFWFGKNGSWTNVTGTADPSSGTDGVSPVASRNDGTYASGMFFQPLLSCWSNGSGYVNFGQRPFSYTIPTGYKSLCSANLSDPTILLPDKHFDTLLYSGTGSSQNITGLEFKPDWVWIKKRSGSDNHNVADTVRGAGLSLRPSTGGAETSSSGAINAFLTNGFTVVDAGETNENGYTYAAWNWDAGETDGKTYTVKVVSDSGNKYRFDDFGTSAVTLDLAEGGTYIFDQSDSSNAGHPLRFSTTSNGTHGGGSEYTTGVTTSGTPGSSGAYTQIVVAASAPTLYYYCTQHSGMGGQANTNSTLGSSNFDGAIQSVVKANTTAGFSIVLYSGSGSNTTVGHGLGVAPSFYVCKTRNGANYAEDWVVYHKSLGATKNVRLQSTAASDTQSVMFNDTEPTSSVFSLGTNNNINGSGGTFVAYCFSEVSSFSKFGSYVGNGNSDGVFVFTGHRPSFLIIKRISNNAAWYIYDNKRNTFNVVDLNLKADATSAEATYTTVDFLSNGFKIRTSNSAFNTSGNTYIYLCFAESPFKNARAR